MSSQNSASEPGDVAFAGHHAGEKFTEEDVFPGCHKLGWDMVRRITRRRWGLGELITHHSLLVPSEDSLTCYKSEFTMVLDGVPVPIFLCQKHRGFCQYPN